jgi:hypothetical protein
MGLSSTGCGGKKTTPKASPPKIVPTTPTTPTTPTGAEPTTPTKKAVSTEPTNGEPTTPTKKATPTAPTKKGTTKPADESYLPPTNRDTHFALLTDALQSSIRFEAVRLEDLRG